MKTELIRIGNSRGIRIPKPLIEQCGLKDIVELRAENDRLIVSPQRHVRQGWAEAFRSSRTAGQDKLLLQGMPENEFDDREWEW